MTDNKSIVDLYAKVISEQARKEQGIIAEEGRSEKVKGYESEPVSKGKDHEIRYTAGDDSDIHYHGHINGKKFDVSSAGTVEQFHDTAEGAHKEHMHIIKHDLKKSGITGADHKKVSDIISAHVKKEMHASYNP